MKLYQIAYDDAASGGADYDEAEIKLGPAGPHNETIHTTGLARDKKIDSSISNAALCGLFPSANQPVY